MRVPRKSSRIIPIAFSFWISAEGHSASRLCAAVLLLDSDGQAVRKGDQCPHGRDGHAPFFLRCKVQFQSDNGIIPIAFSFWISAEGFDM
jgi:hypothetical protein